MANLSVAERNQLERIDLLETGDRLTRPTENERKALTVLTAVFVVVLGALTYAAMQVFDGWHHLIVLGDIAIVFFGIAAWVYPQRKHA